MGVTEYLGEELRENLVGLTCDYYFLSFELYDICRYILQHWNEALEQI